MENTVNGEFMTIEDVQRELHKSRSSVYVLLDGGELDSIKSGRRRLILRTSYNEYLERLYAKTHGEA